MTFPASWIIKFNAKQSLLCFHPTTAARKSRTAKILGAISHYATVFSSSLPMRRSSSSMSFFLAEEGFFVPFTYAANRGCGIPNRRANAEAFSSGNNQNMRPMGFVFFGEKNPESSRPSSKSSNHTPSQSTRQFSNCFRVAFRSGS